METDKFQVATNGSCRKSSATPDQKAIKIILASAKKKPLKTNAIIIARYQWLSKHKLNIPEDMELANLCLTIKDGKLIRAFYSNILSHIIKKQNYSIQILN